MNTPHIRPGALLATAVITLFALTLPLFPATGDDLVTSPEIITARTRLVDRLNQGRQYREALRELLDLRTEVPRRQGLGVDDRISATYRAIGDAICDGEMGENDRGELVYRKEMAGYALSGTNRNLNIAGSPTREITNMVKRTRMVAVPQGPAFITNKVPKFEIRTNTLDREEVVSNLATARAQEPRIDWFDGAKTNRTETTKDVVETVWAVKMNTRDALRTNVDVTIIPPMVITGLKTNIMDTWVDPASNKIDYEYLATSVLVKLTNYQKVTNKIIPAKVVTNTSFIPFTVTNFTSNSSQVTRQVPGEPKIEITPFRYAVTNTVDVNVPKWEFRTNRVPYTQVLTNQVFVDEVIPGLPAKYEPREEIVPEITLVADAMPSRKRPLVPLALKYYDLAIQWCNRLIAQSFQNPFQETAFLRKAEIFRDIEQPSLAVETFSQFQRTFPRSTKVLQSMVERANLYASLGRPGDAEVVLREALEVFPDTEQKAFLRLKIETLGLMQRPVNAAGRSELDRKVEQVQRFETELRRQELRLPDFDRPVRTP